MLVKRRCHSELVFTRYGACSASAGAEAIAKLETEPDIGLVFTDILMPGGMSGFELAAEIRRRRPEIPILMTSGFPGHFVPGACASFPIIRKPFTQIDLLNLRQHELSELRIALGIEHAADAKPAD